MSRQLKENIEQHLRGRYSDCSEALLVNAIGLTGVDANRLRRELRSKNIEMHMVPNRMLRRAVKDRKLAPLAGAAAGPCALVTGGSSIVETAKLLMKLATDFPKLELKIGIAEGLDAPLSIEDVSKLRSRGEVIGDVVMLAVSPGRRLAGAIRAPGGRVAGCLKTIIDKLEKGEAISKVA